MTQRALLRLIDANANRALEGIRVSEEIMRFHFESAPMFRRCRAVRHAIARAVRALPVSRLELARARATSHDVGSRAAADHVESLERLLVINLQRAKESLRTLEECARLFAPHHAAPFQQLRFHTYDLERDCLLKVAALRHR